MTTAKKTGGNLHITSDLEYHKYAALVVHMDIDRYMRKGEKTGGQHVTKANENFVKVCSEYLDGPNGLKKCEEKYRRANKDNKIPDDYSSSYEKF